MISDFKPPFYLKNPMLQTFLSSSGLRKLGRDDMDCAATEVILDAGSGARLQGVHSRRSDGAKGLVILIHGWEGSAESAYIVSTARYFYRNRYDIFRLNLRDHGASHHLNEGLFYGTLIDETHAAVRKAAALSAGNPVFLMGFSMGANFSLRVASRHGKEPVPGLAHVLAVNPPLDPHRATVNIDRIGAIRRYFMKKWKRSLRKKQALFPARYDFSRELEMGTCMEITESLIRRLTEYGSAENYFAAYNLTKGWLDTIKIPVTILMSRDDPFIPADDFRHTTMGPGIRLMMQEFGGHCGYIDGLKLGSWYQGLALGLFEQHWMIEKDKPQRHRGTEKV
ncbi:MAG TPA: alpha/beta fold hydrolase [Spirochaetota bacterium]|nr:alpha/beta fold hydrolase [Spirochaetota bacterium]